MPLYEYECKQCGRHTEKIQKFSDTEITVCPHCGGPLERVISAPAISFKGGGWFADGYGNAKPSSASDGKSDSGSSSDVPSVSAAASANKESSPSPAPAAPAAASTPASSSSDKK
jgi:putative FmdB family regulatory protein